MSNQAPCIRMVLFRVWTEGGRQQKTPGAETPGALVREAGLEPARPEWTLEPESSESTNSTTRACCQLAYNSIYAQNCQQKNFLFRQFSPAGESLVSAHRIW